MNSNSFGYWTDNRLNAVYNERINLFTIHSENPGLRVENYLRIESSSLLSDAVVHSSLSSTSDSDDIEIDEQNGTQHNDAIAAYLADDLQTKDNDVVYCPQLWLVVERIKEGLTFNSLWNVIPQN
jgi:hypothetical protein